MTILKTLAQKFKAVVKPVFKEYCMGIAVFISPVLPRIPQNKKQAETIQRDHKLYDKYYSPNAKEAEEVSIIIGAGLAIFGIGSAIVKFILKL